MNSFPGMVRRNQLCKKVFLTTLLQGVNSENHKNLWSVPLFSFGQLK